VADYRYDETDVLTPRITHGSEQIWCGDTLEQDYNFLTYEFDTEGVGFRARAYLDEIHTVSILCAYDAHEDLIPLTPKMIHPDVLAYLRRRYERIMWAGPNGFALLGETGG